MNRLPRQKAKRRYLKWVGLVALVVVAAVIVLNRAWVYDWLKGVTYRPTTEMTEIKSKLNLTGRGGFLFDAAQPELNDAGDFNENCRRDESETAVLGCYTAGNIYIYDIVDAKLAGIRELTAAHELLHVVWARMNEGERLELVSALTQVFDKNQDLLEPELDNYDISERQEELYVRAGTEVKKLPEALEKHYAEIFKNQDLIVDYYDSYIAVFREIKTQMEKLMSEIESLRIEIDEKTAEYKTRMDVLEADIDSFNGCASMVGCFVNEREFYIKRGELLSRENALEGLNAEINSLIDTYNAKVDEYNADVTESRKLQNMINSRAENLEIRG